jgi:hypothetical protein
MPLDSEAKQRIQVALALALVIAGGRTAYVLYERHLDATVPAKKEEKPLDPDYYVTPKKLYPYDLKSANQLTQQPVWIKAGYYFDYFPFNAATRRVDFQHPVGKLLPLEKLNIKDVVVDRDPDSPNSQVMAVYDEGGHPYAFEIGTVQGSDYKFRADEMLFYEDPQQLYKHWPPDIWDAISKHEVKPGMNVLQVQFAIGFGLAPPGTTSNSELDRTLHYPNGGNPMTVTYVNGRATTITPGS